MTKITTPVPYTPSHNVNNGAKITFADKHIKTFFKNDDEGKVKRAALGGSVATTALYLFTVAKIMKKKSFKPSDMLKVDFNSILRTIGLATSALVGGLAGGVIADKKENRKPKLKEAVHQFFGNIVTPITIVGIATSQIEKKKYPQMKAALLGGAAAIVGVSLGVTGGNLIASKVNEKVFKENDDRKVGVKDFGIHVDDLLTVMGMTDLGETVKSFVSKALPLVFLFCGYEAGTRKVGDDNDKHSSSAQAPALSKSELPKAELPKAELPKALADQK